MDKLSRPEILTNPFLSKLSKSLYSFFRLLSQIQHLVSNYRQRQHLILCFHSLLNSHYYHQILLFSIFFPLLLLFSTFFIHPTFFLKVSTLFHQLHFLCNLPIHRKKIIVLPYSPIHNISLMFSLVFFTHHLKHHLHFLVFFTLFSRF